MEEDEVTPIQSSPYQAPMYNYASSILQLTNPEQELYKLELTLRNQMEDNNGNIRQIGLPTMNDEGICSVMGQIQIVVNQVTIMSSLDRKKEIPQLIDYLGDCLAKDLMVNATRYNLNLLDRDRIYTAAILSAFICMKRACSEEINDKKFWRGAVQEINQKVEQVGKKGGGFLSRIFPGGK